MYLNNMLQIIENNGTKQSELPMYVDNKLGQ